MVNQIIPTNHHFALLEVLADSEGEKVLVNLALQVELFDEESSTLTPRNRSKTDNTVTRHPAQPLLVRGCNKSHVIDTLIV